MKYLALFFVLMGQIILPQYVFAYIGPGAGISAIGTVVAFIGAILLAIVGFIWYPMKRLLVKMKKKEKSDQETDVS
jgi:uncharacterized membrane protein